VSEIDVSLLMQAAWREDQCWDLVAAALRQLGVDLPSPENVLAAEHAYGRVLADSERTRCGDVVVMSGRQQLHVGVVSDAGGWKVTHTRTGGGVVTHELSRLRSAGCVLRIVRPTALDDREQS
jgi:hypothetical protein